MTDLALECSACSKKFRISFAVKPKQATCPQCKAKVSTSQEPAATPTPAAAAPAAATPTAVAPAGTSTAATPATPAGADAPAATVSTTAGAKMISTGKPLATPGSKPSQPKPKKLPTLLNTEEVEFKGWAYDQDAEKLRAGLQKADVLGVLWIGGVLIMIGFILFRLLKSKLIGEGVMGLGGAGLMVAGYLFLQLKKKPDESACLTCHAPLGSMITIPLERECQANNYTRGASGHAYRLENGPTPKLWEIQKKWHICKPCQRYFLAEKEALDFVGGAMSDMEKREALYAEAATTAAAAPKPAAPASEPPPPAAAAGPKPA